MNTGKFQLYSDKAKTSEYRFRLLSRGNYKNILHATEGYTTKQNCQKAIASVKVNAPIDARYDRKTTESGKQFYFVLKAGNGEPLGMSEMYNSTAARENGIDAVKRDAPDSPIEDLT